MKARVLHIILLTLAAGFFTSCYTYRYMDEGEHVLYHNEFDIKMADSSAVSPEVKDALKNVQTYSYQKPNCIGATA